MYFIHLFLCVYCSNFDDSTWRSHFVILCHFDYSERFRVNVPWSRTLNHYRKSLVQSNLDGALLGFVWDLCVRSLCEIFLWDLWHQPKTVPIFRSSDVCRRETTCQQSRCMVHANNKRGLLANTAPTSVQIKTCRIRYIHPIRVGLHLCDNVCYSTWISYWSGEHFIRGPSGGNYRVDM